MMHKAHRLAILAVAGALVAAGLVALRSSSPNPSANASALLPTASVPVGTEEEDASIDRVGGLRRDPGACSVTLRGEAAHLSDDAIAVAALDAFDPKTRVANVEAESTGRFTVKGCRGPGVRVPVAPKLGRGVVEVQTSLVRGAPEWIDDAGLGGSVMARLVVGEVREPCTRQVGFLVLATLRGTRIDIDAMGPWEGSCAPPEPLTSVPWATTAGGETRIAFLEDVSPPEEREADADEPDVRLVQQRVWLKRGPRLIDVGLVTTELETLDTLERSEEPSDVGIASPKAKRNMTAEIASPHPEGGLSFRETWTLVPPAGAGGKAAAPKTVDVVRSYRLEGDRLIRVPKDDPR